MNKRLIPKCLMGGKPYRTFTGPIHNAITSTTKFLLNPFPVLLKGIQSAVYGIDAALTGRSVSDAIRKGWNYEKPLNSYKSIGIVNIPIPEGDVHSQIESLLSYAKLAKNLNLENQVKSLKHLIKNNYPENMIDNIKRNIDGSLIKGYTPEAYELYNLFGFGTQRRYITGTSAIERTHGKAPIRSVKDLRQSPINSGYKQSRSAGAENTFVRNFGNSIHSMDVTSKRGLPSASTSAVKPTTNLKDVEELQNYMQASDPSSYSTSLVKKALDSFAKNPDDKYTRFNIGQALQVIRGLK